MKLILASTSTTRIGLLRAAGVDFEAVGSDVDERQVEAPLLAEGVPPALIATRLADAKAVAVSTLFPDALAIGADQVLDLAGNRFVKPADREDAALQLRRLAGRSYHLRTSLAIASGGETVWRYQSAPCLTMRSLSPSAIERYLDRAGDSILWSVGGYLIEGVGIQLFSEIEGDYFSILGLPLLPLLEQLRRFGALPME